MQASRFIIGGGLFLFTFLSYTYISPGFLYLLSCFLTGWEFRNIYLKHRYYAIEPIYALGAFALSGIVSTGVIFSTDPEEALRLVLFVAMSDVVQYLSGFLLGGGKVGIWPSPNKTVAGYASLLGWAITGYFITGIGLRKAFWWIVGGVGGDLFVSACKRLLNIKDSGNMLGSHGGWFDRVDSIYGAAILYILRGPM